jgi:hypothetical protein
MRGMKPTRSVELPIELIERLEAEARDMGLTLGSYVEFLRRCKHHQHSAAFVDASRYVFKKFPESLRKLAQ